MPPSDRMYIGFVFSRPSTGTIVRMAKDYSSTVSDATIIHDAQSVLCGLGPGWDCSFVEICFDRFEFFKNEEENETC